MKSKLIIALLLFLGITSCESDIDYTDLTYKQNYMMEVTVFFDPAKPDEEIRYELINYQTNSINQLVSHRSGLVGSNRPELQVTDFIPVKEFKKVGIKLTPKINIIGYRFIIRPIVITGFENSPIVEIEEAINGPVTIYYDFETKTIIRE